jgi:hypothetical protein
VGHFNILIEKLQVGSQFSDLHVECHQAQIAEPNYFGSSSVSDGGVELEMVKGRAVIYFFSL